jgi:phosphoesterase RecJ-like protein
VKFSTLDIEKLKSLLASPQKVVIVSHKNPDGDALGSSLGWLFFLQKLAHDVVFVSPNDFTKNLSWIPGTDLVLPYDNDTKRPTIQERIEKAEVIFCLDFNALSRVEELGERIKNASAIKVMIDHHQQPESFAALTFSDTSYCATAEMVHDIIVDLGYEELIDGKIALCLYTGLTTDSGTQCFARRCFARRERCATGVCEREGKQCVQGASLAFFWLLPPRKTKTC